MSFKNTTNPLTLVQVNSNTFNGAYASSGLTFPGPVVQLRFINQSNVDAYISYDGVTNHDLVAAGTQANLNFQTNALPTNYSAALPQGITVYLMGLVAGVGEVTITGYYIKSGSY